MIKNLCFQAENFQLGSSVVHLDKLYPIWYFGSYILVLVMVAAIILSQGLPHANLVKWVLLAVGGLLLYFLQPLLCGPLPMPAPFSTPYFIFPFFFVPLVFCLALGTLVFRKNHNAQTALMLISLFTTWKLGAIALS